MKFLPLTLVLPLLAVPLISRADTIEWGSAFNSINLQSDGVTAVDGESFTIQLGKFTSGFQPNPGNVDLWDANWVAADTLDPGEHSLLAAPFNGYYTSKAQLLDNSTFAAGDQAYVWMFNSKATVPGSEWLLYTNDSTDGSALDDWLYPLVTGSQQVTPLLWRVSNATNVVFGGLNPDGPGPGDPEYGGGHGTNPATPFHVQTRTFVPEPSSGLLALCALLAGTRRRR
jgi:hypothetical protein